MGEQARALGITLLFTAGTRPDGDAMAAFARSAPDVALSHGPAVAPYLYLVPNRPSGPNIRAEGSPAGYWVELLREGLTFDLIGLRPGEGTAAAPIDHCFDFPDHSRVQACEALCLLPGPHLAGGEHSLPVVRGLLALARDLVHHFEHLEGLIWPPSRSVIGRRFFESTVTAWLEGGAFPGLGLTAFSQAEDGALQSVGLSHFIKRELRIEPALAQDRVAATRLAIRLVNLLVAMGGIESEERVTAPDGSALVLRPSADAPLISVSND